MKERSGGDSVAKGLGHPHLTDWSGAGSHESEAQSRHLGTAWGHPRSYSQSVCFCGCSELWESKGLLLSLLGWLQTMDGEDDWSLTCWLEQVMQTCHWVLQSRHAAWCELGLVTSSCQSSLWEDLPERRICLNGESKAWSELYATQAGPSCSF